MKFSIFIMLEFSLGMSLFVGGFTGTGAPDKNDDNFSFNNRRFLDFMALNYLTHNLDITTLVFCNFSV